MAGLDSFWIGSATHAGRRRDRNEDSFLARPDAGVFAVADGMGGHEAGDVASTALIQALSTISPQRDPASLQRACENRLFEANSRIRALAAQRHARTMGSTVVALAIRDGRYACYWAGDSRAYLSRRGSGFAQITRDHTEVGDLLERGLLTDEEAKLWPRRNVVTRAIGVYDQLDLELRCGSAFPGDAFLLCSDGLTLHVGAHELEAEIERRGPQRACDELVELALERGGEDNVTVVVIRYRPDEETTLTPGHGRNRA